MKFNSKIGIAFLAVFLGLSQIGHAKTWEDRGKEAGEKVDSAVEKAKEKGKEVADAAKEKAEQAKEKAKDAHDAAKDKAHKVIDKA